MHLFISGALPPAAIAREFTQSLAQHAPTLHRWMQRGSARVEIFAPHETGCTPAEAWELRRAGFQPHANERLSAGLGPLRAGFVGHDKHSDEPVWLVDLVHLALDARQATLTPPNHLAVTEDEDRALFAAVTPCLDGTGISITPLSPGRWRVALPSGLALPSASPAVVSGAALDAWWPQDEASRPWRRWLNEVQMVWHDHPVNSARVARGQPPINSLWLYGGARPWPRPHAGANGAAIIVRDDLAAPAAVGDWATWLTALATLDREVLAPLAARHAAPSLVLAGDDRLVTLTPSRNLLASWLSRRTLHWTSWWSPQV